METSSRTIFDNGQLCSNDLTNVVIGFPGERVIGVVSVPIRGTRSRALPPPWHHGAVLSGLLAGYQAAGETETADVERMRRLAAAVADPWSRSLPLHFTASALIVHPETRRVLLRWHHRHELWLQVGGHADPGEADPLLIALREAAEETGLTDLVPWPDAALRHAAVCHVRASATEPQHEHADLRYFFATRLPDAAVPEDDKSPLRWLTIGEARSLVGGNNVRHTLDRAAALLAQYLPQHFGDCPATRALCAVGAAAWPGLHRPDRRSGGLVAAVTEREVASAPPVIRDGSPASCTVTYRDYRSW